VAANEVRSLKVIIGSSQFTVPAFEHNSVLYASFTELAKELSFRTYSDDAKGKLEIVIEKYRLKLTADNPFLVVVGHNSNTIERVFHMPLEVMRTNAAYYVPLAAFLPLFSEVWLRDMTLRLNIPELVISSSSSNRPVAKISNSNANDRKSPEASISKAATAMPPEKKSGSEYLAPKSIAPEVASKRDIIRLTVDTRQNGTLITIHSRKRLGKVESNRESSGKLVVDISNATIDVNEIRQTPIGGDDVLGIRALQNGNNARIEFDLGSAVDDETIGRDSETDNVLLTLYKRAAVQKIFSDEQQEKKKGGSNHSKWALDCIVLDAGHGGKDPGAIGVNGLKEKNATLGITLKLGELIESKMKGVKVVYTRKDDTFVELDQRGKIANAAGGKLFISVHCNSTEQKPTTANGMEVYLLRPGRTDEAIRIAEFENSVITLEKDYKKRYEKLTNENFILVNMAQSAYVKYSERFAELVSKEAKGSKQLRNLGVKQAGFYVLVGASMPSILLESGFISNPKEEAFLGSRSGQQHVANALYDAIEKFMSEYEKDLKE